MGEGSRYIETNGAYRGDDREAARLAAAKGYWEFWGPKLDWAKRELPDESPAMAASAYQTLARHWGRRPTRGEVLNRLRQQRRDIASIEEDEARLDAEGL
jgi:hypothetical protein